MEKNERDKEAEERQKYAWILGILALCISFYASCLKMYQDWKTTLPEMQNEDVFFLNSQMDGPDFEDA